MNVLHNIITHLWWGGDPDERNPISGMSLRDVHHVKSSWAKVNADASTYGFQIFTRVFRAEPDSKALFSYLGDASEAQMASEPMFRAHVLYVMASLNDTVEHLQQPEIVIPLMRRLGETHLRKNIKRKHFRVFRGVLVQFLQSDLQQNTAVLESWRLFIEFIYQHIFISVTE